MSGVPTRMTSIATTDDDRLQQVVKLLLGVAGLVLVWGMVTNLPGLDTLVPTTEVTIGALVGAVVTLALVAALGYVAVHLEVLVTEALSGPGDLVADVASLLKYVVLFVAVVVAYDGLAPLVRPPVEAAGLAWTYDLLFFVLALVATVMVVVRMYGNLDLAAAVITDRLTDGDRTEPEETA